MGSVNFIKVFVLLFLITLVFGDFSNIINKLKSSILSLKKKDRKKGI